MKIEIEGDSDAAVALALLQMIAKGEEKEDGASREWVLATFRQCMAAVRDDVFTLEIDDEDDEDEDEEEDDEEEEEEEGDSGSGEPDAAPVVEKTA